MRILALETSTDVGSAAVVENGALLGQFSVVRRFAQSRSLVPAIDFLLRNLELRGEAFDAIAVSVGPGSYTGLRVGLSIAKGLAYSWDVPLSAVNSLDALAQQGKGFAGTIISLIRFRKDEYYSAFYQWDGEEVERRSGYQTLRFAEVLDQIEEPALLLGILRAEDVALLREQGGNARAVHIPERRPEAQFVALLAQKNLRSGITEDVQGITPFYMHEFPVRK